MAALCDNFLVIVRHVINVNSQYVFFQYSVLHSGDKCAIILHCVVQAILVCVYKQINHASFKGI